MLVDRIEYAANLSAVVIFLFLTNWFLLLLVYCRFSIKRISQFREGVQQTLCDIEESLESNCNFDLQPLHRGSSDSASRVVLDALVCSKTNRLDLGELSVSLVLERFRPPSKWFLLQSVATEFGMLFTVIGTSLAFARVPMMKSPMDILIAMQLALLTTVAGLVLKILTIFLCSNPVDFAIAQLSEELWSGVTNIVLSPPTANQQTQEIPLEKKTLA
jgi:hypothetical protein